VTPAERLALAARVRGIEPTTVCWAPTSRGEGSMCGGPVTWTRDGDRFRSSCSRCNATGVAASGDAASLRRLFGRSAAECQGGGP
jgi:hypothetical protein